MDKAKPIRRVVTGHDSEGRSTVHWDGPAPNVHEGSSGPSRSHTDIWAWDASPARLDLDRDDGHMVYDFPCPPGGGHLRVVEMRPKPADYDAASDAEALAPHPPKLRPPGRAWDRGGKNLYSSNMHMTQTIDYGIVLSGEREIILDDAELVMEAGDVVVQIASWHQWSSPRIGCQMAFDMFAATLDGAQVAPLPAITSRERRGRPAGDGPRRIVTLNDAEGRSVLISDGPVPHVLADPARPGYTSAHIWSTQGLPAPVALEPEGRADSILPPPDGTLCRVVTFPPDSGWRDGAGAAEVEAYFASVGAPEASTFAEGPRHPYMQRTPTLDFAMVLEGQITLLLDTAGVALEAGDMVVQRGTNHAWSNPGDAPAIVAITSHSGA